MPNKHKEEVLGVPFGTASAKLRKSIMFWLAGKNNMLICFRCGQPIENVNEFSIEHKLSWENSLEPKKMFFDLENIAFSHLKCNSGTNNRDKICCPRGHKYDKIKSNGDRQCSICNRKTWRESKRKHYDVKKRHEKYVVNGY